MSCRWLWTALCAAMSLAASAAVADDNAAGKTLAQAQCGQCHVITRVTGPDAAGIPSFGTLADRPATTAQSVAAVVRGPHMSGLNLPADKASAIAAYVMSLRQK